MALTSFNTALIGINNNSLSINVIGDNLANLNTTAFKSGKATFSELLAGLSGTSETGNPISFGLGSILNGVNRNVSQGTVTYTGISTDVAINGNGFFVVSTDGGGTAFTRSGSFQFDNGGNLLTADGYQLMGYPAVNGVIDTNQTMVPIQIKKGQILLGSPTTTMSATFNLDNRLANGSQYSQPIRVLDSLGVEHVLTVNFTKTGALGWDYNVTIPAVDTGGAETDPPVPVGGGSGSLTFNPDGTMVTTGFTNPVLTISNLADQAEPLSITFNMLDAYGNGKITTVAQESMMSTPERDGTPPSSLASISISSDGVVSGLPQGGGTAVRLAQLAMADFANIQGLQKFKGSTFIETAGSGQPVYGIAGTGSFGSLSGSSLEQSNVDMAQEFVNLIQAQRAYQANSRVITTTDELFQDAINLKR
jgi:flagellar hook protein FlgE